MANTPSSLAASYFAKRLGVTPYTARMFMYRVRDAMKSNENFSMMNRFEVDELVVVGKEDD
jgi:hypothetical protein